MTPKLTLFSFTFACLSVISCKGQPSSDKMNTEKSKGTAPLCDTATGACETPGTQNTGNAIPLTQESTTLKIIYFTDPICSSCWGIEPQLRKLKLAYGEHIEIEYRMGGLLPDWSYNSGGISKPSDVAHHWDEVSLHYDMPIDGDVWLEDPLSSSYPPSIAFKAAQLQDHKKAQLFLREIREMVFLQKKNITKWEYLQQAAIAVGLDAEQLKKDYNGMAKTLFEEDLKLAKYYGVRGFPTLFFIYPSGQQEKVYGSKPYQVYEAAILKGLANTKPQVYSTDWKSLFSHYPTLTANEYATLAGKDRNGAEQELNALSQDGKLNKLTTKNGALWRIKP